jgi:hypothetical protein
MYTRPTCYRRANVCAPRLIESYCAECGLLVAASPWPLLLDKIESVHRCPVYWHYSEDQYLHRSERRNVLFQRKPKSSNG